MDYPNGNLCTCVCVCAFRTFIETRLEGDFSRLPSTAGESGTSDAVDWEPPAPEGGEPLRALSSGEGGTMGSFFLGL